MMKHHLAQRARVRIVSTLVGTTVMLSACSDSTGSSTPPIQSLSVSGVRVTSATFGTNGQFGLGLVATSDAGDAILSTGVGISAQVTSLSVGSPATYTISTGQTSADNPRNAATQATILMDNSGSMSSNDPSRLRSAAAKLFWEAVLPVRTTNRVAFLDFGAGTTTGFSSSRVLVPFTSSAARLDSALARVVASGGTPLYESLRETARWIDTATASGDNRVMLLLSDGQPNSNTSRDSALAMAVRANITVHTVGLGPASDLSASPLAAAVNAIREVADRSGGVYAAATSAAALGPIFSNIARASSRGQLLTTFTLRPVPASGTRVGGTVTVTSGGASQTASWSFVVP
jgi:Mg-chelatase subunit ChlD